MAEPTSPTIDDDILHVKSTPAVYTFNLEADLDEQSSCDEERRLILGENASEDLRAISVYLESWSSRQSELFEKALTRLVDAGIRSSAPVGPSRSSLSASGMSAVATGNSSASADPSGHAVLSSKTWEQPAACDGAQQRQRPSYFVSDSTNEKQDTNGRPIRAVARKMKSFISVHSEGDNRVLTFVKKSVQKIAETVEYTSMPFSVPEDDKLRWCMHRIVSDRYFNLACALLILANAVTIAISTDMAVQQSLGKEAALDFMDSIEVLFATFYTLELALRIFVYRLHFFTSNEDWAWNSLDFALVTLALYDTIVFLQGGSEPNANLSFIRLIRVMKVVKTFRAVRVLRMFHELRLMVNSIFGCLKSLFWGIIMIALVTYIFGCCFTQACALYLNENRNNSETHLAMINYWSSIPRSMDTLYKATTSGDGWRFSGDPLFEAGAFFYMLFLVYIAFFLFVVVNTLTSIILEATISNSEKEKQELIEDTLKRKNALVEQFCQLYRDMDDDMSGDVDFNELKRHLEDPKLIAFFDTLEIDASDVAIFFGALSQDGLLPVDVDTFVTGCMKMKGSARSMDLLALSHEHRTLCRQLEFWQIRIESDMRKTMIALRTIWGAVKQVAPNAQAPISATQEVAPTIGTTEKENGSAALAHHGGLKWDADLVPPVAPQAIPSAPPVPPVLPVPHDLEGDAALLPNAVSMR